MNGTHQFKKYQNILIINSIVTKRIKVIDNSEQFNYNEIHQGMVAGLCTVHEVDILIESLHQYDINEKKQKCFYLCCWSLAKYE